MAGDSWITTTANINRETVLLVGTDRLVRAGIAEVSLAPARAISVDLNPQAEAVRKARFLFQGEGRGGSDFKKRNGQGSKPRYNKNDKPFEKDERRSKRSFSDDRRSGDRAADGSYKGSYRGGDRNRRSDKRTFDGRNRSERGYKGGNRSYGDRHQSSRGKEGAGSDQRKPNGFAGFDRGSLGGTKSLGYRAGQGKKKRSFTKATPARLLTHEVLTYIREEGCYLSEGVDKFITYSDKPVKERALRDCWQLRLFLARGPSTR